MSIAKNTKETFLEEIIDNLSGNTRELPVDCKPRTREEVLLAEIEKNTRELNNDEPINIDLSNYYTKEETNNLVEEQINSVINDSNTSSTNTWSSQKIVDYVATVDDVIFEEANGSVVTVNNSVEGYLKNIEILGNTIQDEEDLADIRSVGDKVEGQELYEIPVLSCGKNLVDTSKFVPKNNSTKIVGNKIIMENPSLAFDSGAKFRVINNLKFNTSYSMCMNTTSGLCYVEINFFDKDDTLIGSQRSYGATTTFTLPTNTFECEYIVSNGNYTGNTVEVSNIQLEEGTVATPYEPYQEDKITILSPVQLEKVGDVADRIVEKNGVWGVEKNIGTIVLNGTQTFNYITTTNGFGKFRYDISNGVKFTSLLATIVSSNFNSVEWTSPTKEQIQYGNGLTANIGGIGLIVNNISSTTELNNYLKVTPITIKYQLGTPQFIPLPHDQQIKLRTFANKTNISFLTEIEGTIKAQVPKSLGATVNTHTTQISNLNKELDRVKKLEESTVSTVTTESDFTTVEATSNGYFEDVKLEGKTLVNKYLQPTTNSYLTGEKVVFAHHSGFIFNTKHCYDVRNMAREITIISTTGKPIYAEWLSDNGSVVAWKGVISNSFVSEVFVLPEECSSISIGGYTKDGWTVENALSANIVILEGDHTQNPPNGYIEGLKSVGDGADEIVVSSKNLNEDIKLSGRWLSGTTPNLSISSPDANNHYSIICNAIQGCKYRVKPIDRGYYAFLDKDYRVLIGGGVLVNSAEYETIEAPQNTAMAIFYIKSSNITEDITDRIVHVDSLYKQDKKRLLFYNNETQTWEKPILREWDSIEKHSNGKYYYHQRSGKVVLNGSENWISYGGSDTVGNFCSTVLDSKTTDLANIIADKFSYRVYNNRIVEGITISSTNNKLEISISKSKLNTSQDLTGFKQWLQANNVTVVYQLAEEKVYECTNIDLITYANETNYIVECGAISPKTTLKVHNNISNVVSLLQKKVSVLESNMTSYMITQNRMQLASTYSADSVTFKVDYALCSEEVEYNEDLYNLILNNILVGKDNYNYDKMFTMVLDYVTWGQLSFENFDTLVGLMDIQHNPPIDEEVTEEI